jgi:GT2 family glycosyltransferase
MGEPRISFITVVADPPKAAFEKTIKSVLGQTRKQWEWLLVDDGSTEGWVAPRLTELAASDPRIRIVEHEGSGDEAAAGNAAIAAANGEFVAFLAQGDLLVGKAVDSMFTRIDKAQADGSSLDLCYSDQTFLGSPVPADKTEPDAARYIKPDWSPERLRHHFYTAHLSAFRKTTVEQVGGLREGFAGATLHDLTLRISEQGGKVLHAPAVLYRRQPDRVGDSDASTAGEAAWDAGVRAVQEHLDRVGIRATASRGALPGLFTISREPDVTTPVSIIIPTIGTRALVRGRRRTLVTESIRSLLENTDHPNVEFVVVYDTPTPASVLAELRALNAEFEAARIRLIQFREKFNWSAKNNVGASHASGDALIFLNDDVEAVSHGVIEHLLAPLGEEGVGMTGPKLLYENGLIQHAGVIYGSGLMRHTYYQQPDDNGAFGELTINRECSAMTGACFAVRRDVYEEAGGFNENLPLNYNDIDFCLKVRRNGYRLVWLHDVVLTHFESITRETGAMAFELETMWRRWNNVSRVPEAFSNTVRKPILKEELFGQQMAATATTPASVWLA